MPAFGAIGIPPESQANLDAANARIPGQQQDIASLMAAINQSQAAIGLPQTQQPQGGAPMAAPAGMTFGQQANAAARSGGFAPWASPDQQQGVNQRMMGGMPSMGGAQPMSMPGGMDWRSQMPAFGQLGGQPFSQQAAQQMFPQFMQQPQGPQIGNTAPNWQNIWPNAQYGPIGVPAVNQPTPVPPGQTPPPTTQPQNPSVEDKMSLVPAWDWGNFGP